MNIELVTKIFGSDSDFYKNSVGSADFLTNCTGLVDLITPIHPPPPNKTLNKFSIFELKITFESLNSVCKPVLICWERPPTPWFLKIYHSKFFHLFPHLNELIICTCQLLWIEHNRTFIVHLESLKSSKDIKCDDVGCWRNNSCNKYYFQKHDNDCAYFNVHILNYKTM